MSIASELLTKFQKTAYQRAEILRSEVSPKTNQDFVIKRLDGTVTTQLLRVLAIQLAVAIEYLLNRLLFLYLGQMRKLPNQTK